MLMKEETGISEAYLYLNRKDVIKCWYC
jgi:hypothetical protein